MSRWPARTLARAPTPEQIRTDFDCRAARPKFDKGAWRPAKISDVTGGGLYLFVMPDASRPGNAASKLWRMGYRFHSRQKTYSIVPYGNGKDGTFSLADARRELHKTKSCSRKTKTLALKSSSTSTGRRPPQTSATILFSMAPSLSISQRTTSPTASSRGGLKARPTPPGVPVKIRSPGCSVMACETYAI